MLRNIGIRSRTLAVVAAAAIALSASAARTQTITLATDSPGSTFNAIGSGVAKIVTQYSKVRVIVKSFAGPDAYVSALDRGEIDLATMSAVSAYDDFTGKNPMKKRFTNMRLLRSGEGGLRLTFLVARKSSIRTVTDVKGKRMSADFGGHDAVPKSMGAVMATVGLGWKDVKPVPVTGVVDAVRALGNDRVDVTWVSLGMPVARQVNAQIGVRYLSIPNSPKALAILRQQIFPGVQLIDTKANPGLGLDHDTVFMTYDSYILARKDLDPKIVQAVLAALWDHSDELTKIHRGLHGFTHAKAVTDIPVVPYHPAAIEFYKAKKVWTGDAAAANSKLKG